MANAGKFLGYAPGNMHHALEYQQKTGIFSFDNWEVRIRQYK
jgi:hypothetical protein